VTGLGPIAGQALADHMDVDKIAFTGSSAGKHILKTTEEARSCPDTLFIQSESTSPLALRNPI
jgi:acyl-CoA reductase-like NAD-dependent aldehyde dehydrogenase